jgi:superoxide reductase
MKELKDLLQSADWKSEKHVPVIEIATPFKEGEFGKVTVGVGKEIAHPNTTAHHIMWIEVYFLADGDKFPYQVGRADFSAHGASTDGADTSGIYTHPEVTCAFRTDKSGTVLAKSYCNIHGLWVDSLEVKF